MDIRAKIEEIVDKVKNDKTISEDFAKDPVKTIESLIGVDIPDEQAKQVAEGVKAKLHLDGEGGIIKEVEEAVEGVADKIKDFFHKD
ncbi:MAG: hypothetical protein RSC76_01445 [Oscillospiraceae bacterium]